jgi:hypothetical protein
VSGAHKRTGRSRADQRSGLNAARTSSLKYDEAEAVLPEMVSDDAESDTLVIPPAAA